MLIVPGRVVGEWDFTATDRPSCDRDRACLQPLLEMAQVAASVLAEQELLTIEGLTFSTWLKYDAGLDNMIAATEEAPLNVEVATDLAKGGLVAYCNALLDEQEKRRDFLFPAQIEFSGTGLVLTPGDAAVRWPRVTNFYVHEFAGYRLTLNTQCDAWLPFSLKSIAQPQIYQRNAPRLATALADIQKQLNATVEAEDHTRYSYIKGYQLENLMDEGDTQPDIYFLDEELTWHAPEE